MRLLALAVSAALVTGCAAPAFNGRDYELKAVDSADAVASAVATALLGVQAAEKHRTTEAYLSVLVGSAEKDALSVQGTFDSTQPPRRSDALRAELDTLLSDATSGLAELRITVRRGELDQLGPIAAKLRPTLNLLRRLAEDHR